MPSRIIKKIELSPSVKQCVGRLSKEGHITAWRFTKSLLELHGEYGNKMGKSISRMNGPSDGETKPVDEWLEDLYQFFQPFEVNEIHGRLAIWGLAQLNQSLNEFLTKQRFIEAIKEEVPLIKSIAKSSNVADNTSSARSTIRHALSILESETLLIDQGLQNRGLLGFVALKQDTNVIGLQPFKLSDNFDFFDTTKNKQEQLKGGHDDSGWPIIYVQTQSDEDTIPLRRFKDEKNKDYLYVTNPNLDTLSKLSYFEESDKVLFIYKSSADGLSPLYLYSTIEENLFTSLEENGDSTTEKIEENVDLQSDALSKDDLLGRRPFVNALADYVNRLWPQVRDEAYTIHLGGEWGSGKSNVLDFLEQKLTEEKKDKNGKKKKEWLIVRYDAWENQHVDPPWWIFMDTVYRGIRQKENPLRSAWIWVKEQFWRLFLVNWIYWVSVIFLVLVFYFLIEKFNLASIFTQKSASTEQSDFIKALGTLVPIIGTLWVLFKGVTLSLVPGSSEAALNFQKNMSDPMRTVKDHFGRVISYTPLNVGIFVDNIDRCKPEFTVKLLEGIQTLYKSAKILYVISGDGTWIRKCFEIQYDSFKDIIDKPGHRLGNFFVEKIFQMSVNVPNVSGSIMETYWKQLVAIKGKKKITKDDIVQLNKTNELKVAKAREELRNERSEDQISKVLQTKKGSDEEVFYQQAAIEKMSTTSTLQEIAHRLDGYTRFLPANPRSMKRLVNHYALARQSLFLQGIYLNEVSTDSLVRWLILSTKFPQFSEKISRSPELLLSDEYFKIREFKDLVADELKPEVVQLIVGL